MTILTMDKEKENYNTFFLVLESYDMCYDRLGHVNYNFIQRLINLDLLLSMISAKKNYECEVYVESKFIKKILIFI